MKPAQRELLRKQRQREEPDKGQVWNIDDPHQNVHTIRQFKLRKGQAQIGRQNRNAGQKQIWRAVPVARAVLSRRLGSGVRVAQLLPGRAPGTRVGGLCRRAVWTR